MGMSTSTANETPGTRNPQAKAFCTAFAGRNNKLGVCSLPKSESKPKVTEALERKSPEAEKQNTKKLRSPKAKKLDTKLPKKTTGTYPEAKKLRQKQTTQRKTNPKMIDPPFTISY